MKFLDQLFQRYANPMQLLNSMMHTGRFYEFLIEFVQIRNDEVNEKTMWEYWLHRVWDKSFKDYMDSAKNAQVRHETTAEELMETVKTSKGMIQGFCPS